MSFLFQNPMDILPFNSESNYCEDRSVGDGLLNYNLDITGQVTKDPGVLVPHLVQLTRHGEHQCGHVCHRQVEQVHIGGCPENIKLLNPNVL